MRWWWSERPIQVRHQEQDVAQLRVARAVEAAHMVQAGVPAGLGSSWAATGALHHLDAVERAAISGPLHKAKRRAERGLSPDLLWATARVARQSGRKPEEIWAEALRNWLTVQEDEPASPPRPLEARRRQGWSDIDETLRALRAS